MQHDIIILIRQRAQYTEEKVAINAAYKKEGPE